MSLALDVAAGLLGATFILLTLFDVFLAALHMDLPAPVEKGVQTAIWRVIRPIAFRKGGPRRAPVAAAGPLMVVATLVTWSSLLVGGFALMVWPLLPTSFSVDAALGEPDFLDAVYYSMITVTTLGYGDISPVTPYAQVLSILEAGLGFLMLAGVLTYLFTTLEGVFERNELALRVHAATGRTGDGVQLVVRSLTYERVEDLRHRFEGIAAQMRSLEEHFHGYPILAFYYRTVDPNHDPEPMLRATAEAVIAGYLLPVEGPTRGLRPAVEDLEYVLTHFRRVIATQYLHEDVVRALAEPAPRPEDRALVDRIRERLHQELPPEHRPPASGEPDPMALDLAVRSRVFLGALDDLTGWKAFHPRPPQAL